MNLKKELIIRILAVHFNLRFLLFTSKICQICQVAELWCQGNHTKSYNSYTKPNKYTAQGFSRTLSTEMAFILCSDLIFVLGKLKLANNSGLHFRKYTLLAQILAVILLKQ